MDEIKDQELQSEEIMSKPEENNADNVLNTVSDEYLTKKKRTRKITYSTILSIIFAIATIIIVMSSVRVDLKPTFIENPSYYSIFISKNEKMHIDETGEYYEEFYDKYQNSFNVSYLTALFTGKLGAYKIEETSDKFYLNETNKSGISKTLESLLGNHYVKLSYLNEQQMKTADGKVYYSVFNSNEYDLKYEDIYFNITSENVDSELTFYFGTTGAGLGYTITKITVRANTYELYKFATENN